MIVYHQPLVDVQLAGAEQQRHGAGVPAALAGQEGEPLINAKRVDETQAAGRAEAIGGVHNQ